jgi:hypothetical protein
VSQISEAVDAVKVFANQCRGVIQIADALEQIGSIDQATNEATVRRRTVQADVEAAERELIATQADLSEADLSEANHVIHLGCPNGWSNAFAWLKEGTLMVQIGRRSKTMAEAREYWAGKNDRREVMAALDYAEAIAKLCEWEIVP